jgi:uncharacterized protein (TIGR02145 family)
MIMNEGDGIGTFTDERDGQTYRTVKMPDGKVWMAENLRFKIDGSWCYKNCEDNCGKYGRLYDWNMAKLACPKGWHLPSNDEWRELVTVVGYSTAGNKLKSKSGWEESGNGTDDYGFSALPGGGRGSVGGFGNAGYYGYWWTTAENSSDYAYARSMRYDGDYVYDDFGLKCLGASVRCVQE